MERERLDWSRRIYREQDKVFGRIRIRDTDIRPVEVLDCFAAGMSRQEVLEHFPKLKEEDIRCCAAYAAHHVRQSVGWIWVALVIALGPFISLLIPGC